jgi:hypothetical protein
MEVRLKMSKKKIVILMVFICLVPIGLVSTQQYVDRIDIASARSTALGGLHAALTDDLYSLFNNPAGFQSLERELRFAEMTLGLSGPIFDIAGLIIEGIGGADIAALLLDPEVQDLLNGLYAGMNLVGPECGKPYSGNQNEGEFCNKRRILVPHSIPGRIEMHSGFRFAPESASHDRSADDSFSSRSGNPYG